VSDTAPEPESPAAVTATDDEDAGRLVSASRGRLIALLAALVLFGEIVPLQYTLVGVTIPKIGAAFPAAGNSTTWVLTILGVVGAATMALAGKASDLWGKKRVLLVVGVFFLIGTVIDAVTSNWWLFLGGRALQAVSLGIPAVSYGLLRDLIPRRWIPIAIGVVGTGFGLSAVLGPVAAGLLTDHYSYRSIFWFLVIYTVITAPLLALLVPESPYRVRQQFDWVGALLIGAGVAGVLLYISEGASWGWSNGTNLAYLVGGLLLLALFVTWENRISYPMMELSLLRSPQVSLVMAIAVFASILQAMPNYTIPYMMETPTPAALHNLIYAQASARAHAPVAFVKPFIHFQGDVNYAAGMSVFQLAWHVTIFLSISAMIFGPIGGFLARRYGARLPMIIGTAAFLVTFVLWTPFHGAWLDLASVGVLWGLAFGFYYAASPNLIMDVVPAARQGISSGMLAVFGAVGSALATALLTPILAAHPFQVVATPPGGKPIVASIPQVYTNAGYTEVFLLVGIIPAVIALIIAISLRSGREPARGGERVQAPMAVTAVAEP